MTDDTPPRSNDPEDNQFHDIDENIDTLCNLVLFFKFKKVLI